MLVSETASSGCVHPPKIDFVKKKGKRKGEGKKRINGEFLPSTRPKAARAMSIPVDILTGTEPMYLQFALYKIVPCFW